MKKTTFIFVIWMLLLAMTFFKVYPFPTWFLVAVFLFWVFTSYWRIHAENKIARIPKPVYLANPLD